jgi:hypothetical protein
MSRPWIKVPVTLYRRLARLPSDTARCAFYTALQEGKLAESEGEWADEREFSEAVGKRYARSLAALVEADLLEITSEGWIRVVGFDDYTTLDPTNAARQKAWRERRKQELRNALRKTASVTNDIDREIERKRDGASPAAAPDGRATAGADEFDDQMERNGYSRPKRPPIAVGPGKAMDA